jgi:hypothetical protein
MRPVLGARWLHFAVKVEPTSGLRIDPRDRAGRRHRALLAGWTPGHEWRRAARVAVQLAQTESIMAGVHQLVDLEVPS